MVLFNQAENKKQPHEMQQNLHVRGQDDKENFHPLSIQENSSEQQKYHKLSYA